MKPKRNLIQLCLLGALLLSVAVVKADQFGDFTYASDGTNVTITGYTGSNGVVTIPGTIEGLPVTGIGYEAFKDAGMTNILIPDSVTTIGERAFVYCTSLTSITIPNSVTNIGASAFWDCYHLTSVTLSTSLTRIGDGVFVYCDNLSSVTIPSSVTNLGGWVFQFCHSLTSVLIPNSVTSLGDAAFYWCNNLTNVIIGTGVTNLGDAAFSDCFSLTSVYCQGNAPSLGSDVFSFDNNPTVYYLLGTTGWSNFSAVAGVPVALWNPLIQIGDGSFGVQTNQFGFNIQWASGRTVVVEACTNLANPVWQPVQTNTLTTGSAYFSDPQWTNYPGRFYRLRSP